MATQEQRKRLVQYAAFGLGTASVLYLLWRSGKLSLKRQRTDAPGWDRSRAVIAKLHPSIQPMAWQVISDAWNEGIPLVVTSTLRSMEEQQALYDQGRTKPGAIVTNALPGSSWHNYGLAFDVAVLKDGSPSWPTDNQVWSRVGAIGKKVGLSWGGDWSKIPDRPHFEFHPGMTIADARAGVRPTGPPVA